MNFEQIFSVGDTCIKEKRSSGQKGKKNKERRKKQKLFLEFYELTSTFSKFLSIVGRLAQSYALSLSLSQCLTDYATPQRSIHLIRSKRKGGVKNHLRGKAITDEQASLCG